MSTGMRALSPDLPPLEGLEPAYGTVPRAALTVREAAESLGVSLSSFRRHVLPTIKAVRLGTSVIIPRVELDGWLERHGTLNTPYS